MISQRTLATVSQVVARVELDHVRGAESRPWFGENVAILAEMLPDARTQTLPELDHLAPLTHSAELAATIGDFVRHLAPTPS